MDKNSADKGKVFRTLHEASGAFIIPNPWDIGTAKLFASFGFKALMLLQIREH